MPRRYSSTLRDSQAQATRERLLEHARRLLLAGGAEALTLPRVARAAGVSVPTVYRHFPDQDALYAAFLAWVRERVGMGIERVAGAGLDGLPAVLAENYAAYEEHSTFLTPLMESPAFNRLRVAGASARAARAARTLAGRAPPGLDARTVSAPLYALASPQMWRWLRETWGLSSADAARAASWALAALLAALPPAASPAPPAAAAAPARAPRSRRKAR